MDSGDLVLAIVVATALAFDFTNGFHDTANVVATSISTRALPPRAAVAFAAVLNFVGALISLKVAATVAKDVVEGGAITPTIIFAGLVGAIAWNLVTWYFGLPSSSSHALIGGVVGAVFVAVGASAVLGDGLLGKVIVPALVAPILAFVVAGLAITVAYRIVGRLRPGPVTNGFRAGQLVSGGILALAHGTNDAQKTMGVITLALIANGNLGGAGDPAVPLWVVISAATAIALGTYSGGWRIIKTMGTRIHKMDSAQGFSAQGAGAAVILAASHFGYPLSTTHVISGGVMGAGAAKRLSAVRWGVAGNIVVAWVLTLPAAAIIGALVYGLTRLFGTGAAGPVVVTALIVVLMAGALVRRARQLLRPPMAGPPRRAEMSPWLAAAIVDWTALLTVVVVAVVAGVGVTAAFSIGLAGATRSVDLRREGRPLEAVAFALVALVALGICAVAIAFGLAVMIAK